jgi:tetratricopeptide (TPR) repeat protein
LRKWCFVCSPARPANSPGTRRWRADYTAILENDTDFSRHMDGRDKCRAHTYHYRGCAYQEMKDYARAIEDYTSAMAIPNYEDRGQLYWRRALCHKALGQTDQAMADASFLAEQAWDVATNPASKAEQIRKAMTMGRFSSEVFNHTVPDHLEAAAVIYARKGDFREAVSYQKKKRWLRSMHQSLQK